MGLIPRSRGGALWRFALAAVLVIGLTAATTAVAGLLAVQDIVKDLNQTPALKSARVTLPPPGAPQTLLLIGSDHRAGTSYNSANTDTMMLVRINDASSTINLLSIPRDLKVMLPAGTGTAPMKINAAYSIGGPNLLIKTLQQQVFPGLQVNHILDVNFRGFSDMIDAIGCVYTMVDHRYFNDGALTGYSSIYIQPGYQKLCGDDQSPSGALAFVRFRHTDSDIVREARQQDFIRWAKDQYGVNTLIDKRDQLLRIFGKNVQTDQSLHTTDGLLNLFNLIVDADPGHVLKSIPFPATFSTCNPACYVLPSSAAAEERAYHTFMTPTLPKKATSSSSGGSTTFPQVTSTHRATRAHHTSRAVPAGLTADPGDGRSQAAQLGHMPFPVYYPKLIVAGSEYCFSITGNCDEPDEPASGYAHSYPRRYLIHGSGTTFPSYVMTLVINGALGQYYDVEGTTWRHPPILRSPTKVQLVNGKKLVEYYNGGKLSVVAFRTPQGTYWISNSLTDSVPASQLIGVAASLTPAG